MQILSVARGTWSIPVCTNPVGKDVSQSESWKSLYCPGRLINIGNDDFPNNLSIKESVFLKKAGLDIEEYKNFGQVNNLLYLSKLTERCADEQVDGHMTRNNLHEGSQFAYKTHHNTEMILGVTDEVLRGDNNQATVIIFLDLDPRSMLKSCCQ